MAQLSLIGKMRNAEDDRDVRQMIKQFQDEQFTIERLQKTHTNCVNYARQYGKTRGNSNMIRAIEILLKTK